MNEQIAAARPEEVCVTSSFQAEDMVVVHLVRAAMGEVPVIFLDTGYHFAETYAYRDRLAEQWDLNLVNVLPNSYRGGTGVAIRHSEPDCAGPLLRHAQSRSVVCVARALPPMVHRAAPGAGKDSRQPSSGGCIHFAYGQATTKISPLADWSTRDVWQYAEQHGIPLLSLYEKGYTSIGCEPCTSLPFDPNDPRSGRWGGRKQECGIHVQPE